MDLLVRTFKSDYTYNHIGGVRRALTFQGELFSVDLSNATDTIPVSIGLRLISDFADTSIFPNLQQTVQDIKDVMVNRNFWHRSSDLKTGGYDSSIRYSTGQPMGAYSSFPLLAATNHLLVAMAKTRSGHDFHLVKGGRRVPNRGGYVIVGDDIVIRNRKVAEEYIRLLGEFGIPANPKKLVVGVRTFEFCRRIVRDGVIVSVPSWNSYYQAIAGDDPTPIILLMRDYGMDLPRYTLLCRIFPRRRVRSMLALNPDIHLEGEPNIDRIPHDVVTHADRVLSVLDYIKDEREDFVSSDPYLARLSYAYHIAQRFRDQIKESKSA